MIAPVSLLIRQLLRQPDTSADALLSVADACDQAAACMAIDADMADWREAAKLCRAIAPIYAERAAEALSPSNLTLASVPADALLGRFGSIRAQDLRGLFAGVDPGSAMRLLGNELIAAAARRETPR